MSFLSDFFKDDDLVKVNSHGKTNENKRPILRTVVNCSVMAAMAISIASGAFAPKTVHASELETKSPVSYEQVITKEKSKVDAIYLNESTRTSFIKITKDGIEYLKQDKQIDRDNLVESLKNAKWIHVKDKIGDKIGDNHIRHDLINLKKEYGLDLDKRLENTSDFMDKLGVPKEIQSLSEYKYGVIYDFTGNSNLEQKAKAIKENTGIDLFKTEDFQLLVKERVESMKDLQEYNAIRDSVIIKLASDIKDTSSWFFKDAPLKVAKKAYFDIMQNVSQRGQALNTESSNKDIFAAQVYVKKNFFDSVNFSMSMLEGNGNRTSKDIGAKFIPLMNVFQPLEALQGELYKVDNSIKEYTTNRFTNTVIQKKDGTFSTYSDGILENVYDNKGNLTFSSLPDTYKRNFKSAEELNLEKVDGKAKEIHIGTF